MTSELQSYPKSQQRIELLAVVLNLLYTSLYLLEYREAFIPAFIGSSLFVWVCFKRNILAESLLQIFYVFMAGYGWMHFADDFVETKLPIFYHIIFLVLATGTWMISAYLMRNRTSSAYPFVDTFTTLFSILATWYMVNGDPLNWWYWLIIDTVAIWLYYKRKMYFGAAMFAIYLVMAIIGVIKEFA